VITFVTTITAWIHYLRLHWPAAIGPGVGVIGIRTYAKVVRSGAGTQPLSPEEEHAVRGARLGQGQPAAEQSATPDVTVRTRSPRPVPPSLAS
jgi:hypothetical protein